MKKFIMVVSLIVFFASNVFAADFVPSTLTLSASDIIQYNFDGSNIDIPVTVSGTPALVVFVLFTKDKADEIVNRIVRSLTDYETNPLAFHKARKDLFEALE